MEVVEDSKFSVEAILSCDERGSLVLPKDIRRKLGIAAGEKMALLNIKSGEDEFFLTLIKANSLENLIKKYLTPVMKDVIK